MEIVQPVIMDPYALCDGLCALVPYAGPDIEAALLPCYASIILSTGFTLRNRVTIPAFVSCWSDPSASVLEQIETALRRIIAPIPAKPAPVQTVTTEPPRIITPQEAR